MHCRCLLALALLLPACGAPSSERDPSTTPDPPTKEPSHHAPSSPNCTLAAQVDDLSIDLRSDEWPGMSLGNVLQGDVEVFFDPATPERARVRATRFGLTIRGWAVARDVPLYSRDAPTFDEVLFPDGLVTVRFAGHAPNRMVRVVYDRDAGSLAAPVDAVLACDALSLEKVTHPPRIGGPLPPRVATLQRAHREEGEVGVEVAAEPGGPARVVLTTIQEVGLLERQGAYQNVLVELEHALVRGWVSADEVQDPEPRRYESKRPPEHLQPSTPVAPSVPHEVIRCPHPVTVYLTAYTRDVEAYTHPIVIGELAAQTPFQATLEVGPYGKPQEPMRYLERFAVEPVFYPALELGVTERELEGCLNVPELEFME